MKSKWMGPALALCLILGLTAPAQAISSCGVVYDETDQMWTSALETLGLETLPAVTEATGIDLRIDIYTSLGGAESLEEAAAFVYENEGYGLGPEKDGVSLSVLLREDTTGWTPEDWCLYAHGSLAEAGQQALTDAVAPYLTVERWAGDVTGDRKAMAEAGSALGTALEALTNAEQLPEPSGSAATAPVKPDYSAGSQAVTSAKLDYITDNAELLTEAERTALEEKAAGIARRYGCGVYAITVKKYSAYGSKAFDAAVELYHSNELGMGTSRSGALLLLSMDERDFSTFFYGELAEYAFSDYGQWKIEQDFLPALGEDDWYGGLDGFVTACGRFLALAAEGTPVRELPDGQTACITDAAGVLTEAERAALEKKAAALGAQYGCSVYAVTVEDLYAYGNTAEVAAAAVYAHLARDEDAKNDAVLLVLNSGLSEYGMFVCGEQAQYAINDYGRTRLGRDRIEGAGTAFDVLDGYLTGCADYLDRAAAGKPVREFPAFAILLSFFIGLFVATVVCFWLKNFVHNAPDRTPVPEYTAPEGLTLTAQKDTYVTTIVTRRAREQESDHTDSGGGDHSSAHHGGGGSGRSGKF